VRAAPAAQGRGALELNPGAVARPQPERYLGSAPVIGRARIRMTETKQSGASEPLAAPTMAPDLELEQRVQRFGFRGRALRHHAARGTLVNAAYMIGVSALGLVKGFIMAGFLTRADYGLFGVLMVSLGTLQWLKQVGIGDKYVQQDEEDQEVAFQKAFTMEAFVTAGLVVLMLAVLPLVAVIYNAPKAIIPGLAVIATVPAGLFQMPINVHYRRMDFLRQRILQSIEPVVGFVVSIALAIAGAGYWALILGILVGMWAAALGAVWRSPFRLRLRYAPGTLRSYFSFSWPLFIAMFASMVIAQGSVLMTNAHLGLAGAGVITLAAVVTQFTQRVDYMITGSLYPAICAVKDRLDLLQESFVKSNRLALMWGMPFGFGLTLFASDLVHFGLGEEWRPAVVVLQVYGVTAALGMVGFNWDAYFRAVGNTRPIAIDSVAAAVVFLGSGIPLLIAFGLPGFAAAVAIQAVVDMALRAWYLGRLFHGLRYVAHALRSIAPTLPAVAAVLLARLIEPGGRSLGVAVGELVLYVGLTIVFTLVFEGRLLREVLGYLRRAPALA
jgi:O-antigen/teichoic acid export membrane protein